MTRTVFRLSAPIVVKVERGDPFARSATDVAYIIAEAAAKGRAVTDDLWLEDVVDRAAWRHEDAVRLLRRSA